MRLSGLRTSGICWACRCCSHGLGDTVRSSRGASGLFQNRAQTMMALTGVCASVSGSAAGREDGGPAHWPWDAL